MQKNNIINIIQEFENQFMNGGEDMDCVITKAVGIMRSKDDCKVGQDVNVTIIETGGDTYQIYIPTKGCRYACVMCNYGFNHPIREKEIISELDDVCKHLKANVKTIILEGSGSFLDDREIPMELQEKIISRVAKANVPRVQIETHYKTVTEGKLRSITRILKGKRIGVELGLESTNPEVISIYNKAIELDELLDIIWLCDSYGVEVSLNLMLGAPLLTIQERIADTIQSVNWVLKKCPKSTSIVLFPLNIKKYTLVRYLYDMGRYEAVCDWEFIEVLSKLPKESLDRVYISWWGNRCNEFHGEEAIIKPIHCDECHDKLMQFYNSFVKSDTSEEKARLISDIRTICCKCKNEFETRKNEQGKIDISYLNRLEEEKIRLKMELGV